MRNYLIAGLLLALSCNNGPKTLEDQGVQIAYTDSGKGDTTLLFVHGWGLNRTYWTSQMDFFKDKYRVVSVDLPGFGESGTNRDDWSTAAYGRDIDTVMSQLNLKNVVLVGHSMAGDIVLEAALHAPSRVLAIVVVDNFKSVKPESEEDREAEMRGISLMKKKYRETAEEYFKDDLFYVSTPDSIKKRILTDVINDDSAIAIATMAQPAYPETQSLQTWGKKLYLINSDYRQTDTADLTAAHVPFQIYYIRTTGHFPMVERPGEFNVDLEKVLTGL